MSEELGRLTISEIIWHYIDVIQRLHPNGGNVKIITAHSINKKKLYVVQLTVDDREANFTKLHDNIVDALRELLELVTPENKFVYFSGFEGRFVIETRLTEKDIKGVKPDNTEKKYTI